MCGRFIFGADEEDWSEYVRVLELDEGTDLPIAGERHPTEPVTIIAERSRSTQVSSKDEALASGRGEAGGPTAERSRVTMTALWGLLPRWAKDRREAARLFNVRSETVHRKFRPSFLRGRCVVPATAFFEWQSPPSGRGKKVPYLARSPSRPILSLAGVAASWHDPATGEPILSCAILTRDALPPLDEIHHRMPVILVPALADLWLKRGTPQETLLELLRASPEQLVVERLEASRQGELF